MEDENELIQVTIRLPLKDKEKIDNLAKSGGCSTAEIIRRSVDGASNWFRGAPLKPYLPGDTYRFPSEPLLLRKCPIAFPCQNIYNNSGQQKRQAGRVNPDYFSVDVKRWVFLSL